MVICLLYNLIVRKAYIRRILLHGVQSDALAPKLFRVTNGIQVGVKFLLCDGETR